ncbi:MAG: hypothetical protein RL637_70, partial [Pseudomonadota bacterium]
MSNSALDQAHSERIIALLSLLGIIGYLYLHYLSDIPNQHYVFQLTTESQLLLKNLVVNTQFFPT